MQSIIDFRRKLHKHPELSGQEFATQKRILAFVKQFQPDKIFTVAETGLLVVFGAQNQGKTIMFRADIDALPITEKNKTIEYCSRNKGTAHLCGHDGHTAVLLALAQKLSGKYLKKNKVVLLFQPAEETGYGAKAVIEDDNFEKIKPDYVFGFHNLPGFTKNTIYIRKKVFAAASKGLIITFLGKTAHAAEPEKGVNPAFAIAQLIDFVRNKLNNKKNYSNLAFVTIVHLKVGEKAFGTSPAKAVLMLTLRAFCDEDMQKMTDLLKNELNDISKREQLKYTVSETDVFPALVNDANLTDRLINLLAGAEQKFKILDEPFRWSEDFAYFSQKYPAVFFGIGAGKNIPNLHNPNYDFPDDIIEPAAKFLLRIIFDFEK